MGHQTTSGFSSILELGDAEQVQQIHRADNAVVPGLELHL